MTKQFFKYLIIAISGTTLPLVLITPSIFSAGQRNIGTVENIHGIPFPEQHNTLHITEEMAHADIFLKEPVFAKTLEITVTFTPQATQSIDLGVRADPFWLSYEKINIFSAKQNDSSSEQLTKTITIPLTDKLQDSDRSIDLMFFANANDKTYDANKPTTDKTYWLLHDMQAKVIPTKPTINQIKNYIKSIIQRERPA